MKKRTGGEKKRLKMNNILIDLVYPFYGNLPLAGAVLLSVFFGLSYRKGLKILVIIIAIIAVLASLFLNIFYFSETENFSSYLFKFGFLQTIESLIVLFSALNILIFLSIKRFDDRNLIKVIIIFIFSLICINIFIVSKNFLMIFSSLSLFLICFFQLLSLLNKSSSDDGHLKYSIKNYIIRFVLVAVFSLLLILVGFSLIFGATDFKDFTQILQSENIDNTMMTAGIILVFLSIYFYLFIFPFQNAYLKLGKRCEPTSLLFIWFLYFPSGIFLFLKVYDIFIHFLDKNSQVVSIILIAISILCILGGNIGAVSSKSLRRIFLFLFLAVIGMSVLCLAYQGLDLMDRQRVVWLIVANLLTCILFYFPAFAIFFDIEKQTGSDYILKSKGFTRKNKFLGINLIILMFSFAGIIGTTGFLTRFFYLKPHLGFFSGNNVNMAEVNSVLVLLAAIISVIGVLFILANIVRVIVVLLKTPDCDNEVKRFPRLYYPYILIYTMLVLFIGIIGSLQIFNIDISFFAYDIINVF